RSPIGDSRNSCSNNRLEADAAWLCEQKPVVRTSRLAWALTTPLRPGRLKRERRGQQRGPRGAVCCVPYVDLLPTSRWNGSGEGDFRSVGRPGRHVSICGEHLRKAACRRDDLDSERNARITVCIRDLLAVRRPGRSHIQTRVVCEIRWR